MIVLAQQNGAGPIVSIAMGLGSAPSSLAAAPSVTSPEPTDQVLIARAGVLNTIPYGYFSGAIAGQQIAASPPATNLLQTDDIVLLRNETTFLLPWDDLLSQIMTTRASLNFQLSPNLPLVALI